MIINENKVIKIVTTDIVNGTLTIPDGVTEIGNNACENESELYSLILPDSVTTVGTKSFYCCPSLKAVKANCLQSIGMAAFENCKELCDFVLPPTLCEIGSVAFAGCAFTSIEFPESVKEISFNAFESNKKLTQVVFESSKTDSKFNVFYNCPNLDRLVLCGSTYEMLYFKENSYVVLSQMMTKDIMVRTCTLFPYMPGEDEKDMEMYYICSKEDVTVMAESIKAGMNKLITELEKRAMYK